MGAKVRQKKQEMHGNIFWVTMSDLFIGMFMIFATLFFAFCANTGQGQGAAEQQATTKAVEQIVEKLEQKDIKVVERVEQTDITLPTPDDRHDVEIDPFTGMARISDLELFKLNSAELTPEGRKFLGTFLPIYFDEIMKPELKKYLTYVVIQGHTDSHLFRGVTSAEQQYMRNMRLSIDRAYNVAEYTFVLCKNKPYYKDLTHYVRVEGASFSQIIRVNGVEDYKRSRRVELRLLLKEQKMDILQQFLRQGMGGNGKSEEHK